MEFPFDLKYFLELFSLDKTFKQKMIEYITKNSVNVYTPIFIKDQLLIDGVRYFDSQKERLDTLPDFEGESVLDLGCNNGYMLFEILKNKNPGTCYGIDNDFNPLFLGMAKACYEGISSDSIQFIKTTIVTMLDTIYQKKMEKTDNLICFGVYPYSSNIQDTIIHDFISCTNNKIFIEFPNHSWSYKTPKESLEYAKQFEIYGEVKTTILEYQERMIMEIDLYQDKKTPIILTL